MAQKIRQFNLFRMDSGRLEASGAPSGYGDLPGTASTGAGARGTHDISGQVKSFEFSTMGRPLRTVGVGTYQDARIPGRMPHIDLTMITPSSLRAFYAIHSDYEIEIVQDLVSDDGTLLETETWVVIARLAEMNLAMFSQADEDQDSTLTFDCQKIDVTQSGHTDTKMIEFDKTSVPPKFNFAGRSIFGTAEPINPSM